MITLKN